MILALPLHDGWTFHHPDSGRDYTAQVPGCIHTDLRRNELIPDPFWGANELDLQWIEERDWDYSLVFPVDGALLGRKNVELVCEGLDTLATITLNGIEVARTENMFVGYRFDVKNALKEGQNELKIHFASPMPYIRERQNAHKGDEWNDPVGGCSNIRKEQCAFGWDWGPRFATAGIWLPIRLEAWNSNRIETVHVAQTHSDGKVSLTLKPLLAVAGEAKYRVELKMGGETVVSTDSLQFDVPNPQLWWPNGLGEHPLYDLSVELVEEDEIVDVWKKRVGLRTIKLDRHPDEWGETFQFVANGVPFFAKGANWIPGHAFVTETTREDYAGLMQSSVEANMNMIRVWGGGIYELEDFYDICDEMGLFVWQDFGFACGTYPGDEHFLNLVREEAEYQVKRLQHRACMALWCGNNEIETGFRKTILSTPETKRAYEAIFDEILPQAVEKFDGILDYWPSSPHHPNGLEDDKADRSTGGDEHYWEVWHSRAPVKNYEKTNFRFCSEFGMQSYSAPEVAQQFCDAAEMNVFSPAMENHQKNPAGNQIILDYISRQYRFPFDYASLAYLSQLNEAYALKTGVEHFRRSMPRNMGALYWQLNDCWPVFSWSSLEFDGRWKALHYEAKRFFAPALISLFVPGDETPGTSNRIKSTIHEVHIFTVYDGIGEKTGEVKWELRHLDDRVLQSGSKAVKLIYGQSVNQESLDFADAMQEYSAKELYVRAWLEIEGETVSRQTAFLTARRFLDLPRAQVETKIEVKSEKEVEIIFTSPVFQTQMQFHLANTKYRASDNFFDLYPNVPHTVTIRLEEAIAEGEIAARLTTMSLVDSYK